MIRKGQVKGEQYILTGKGSRVSYEQGKRRKKKLMQENVEGLEEDASKKLRSLGLLCVFLFFFLFRVKGPLTPFKVP